MNLKISSLLLWICAAGFGCDGQAPAAPITPTVEMITEVAEPQEELVHPLALAALELTKQQVVYDPSYFSIPYPNGDVPADRGVCTDVVIRAFRQLDIDLQRAVHEDMRANFSRYPSNWGLSRPDKNIDHRRVPNLRVFFTRHGESISPTQNPNDYLPGDVVTWNLSRGMTHIGIVTHKRSRDGKRPLIVHNIGSGQVLEDCLFSFDITGHYRYGPATPLAVPTQ